MNRRTFIKSVGIGAVSLLGTSSIFAKNKEPQWIKFTDQLPEENQKIIVSYPDKESTVYGGTVSEISNNTKKDFFITIIVDFEICKKFFRNTMKNKKYRTTSLFRHVDKYTSSHNRSWIPVNGEYPKILPPFPK